MADQAKVASVEALEDFRAALLRYSQKSKTALDDVSSELKRMRNWLTYDRRMAWEGEVRRHLRRLEQSEAELMTAKLSGLQDDLAAQQMAVKKCRRSLEGAEQKLAATKKWARDFDTVVAPAVKPLDSLRDRVAVDLPKAVSSLDGLIRALDAYTERAPKSAPPGSVQEGGQS